eukprot:Pgem_evm1s9241
MQQSGIKPNIVTYTILIDGCSKNNRIDESMKYWQEMQQRGINPNIFTYNSLIDACSKKKRINE